MLIGIPKEIKDHEYRVGAIPFAVQALIGDGNEVWVQKGAGKEIDFTDEMYQSSGARIVDSAKEIYKCEMIIKVKEPQEPEFPLLHEGQILFCFLHLAPDPHQTKNLLAKKIIGIAYETVTNHEGRLPLLIPMSEMAGRVAVQAGAFGLHMVNKGRGVLLGGIPGVVPGKVVVIGGGAVGTEALRMALGLGAEVTVFDRDLNRLRQLNLRYAPALKTAFSNQAELEEAVLAADFVIGAVLIPGGKAPHLISRKVVSKMKRGAVIVDVAIDQGGCIETSRPTTHSQPYFIEEGVVHYCVTNMPAACARTSAQGLTNAVLPYARRIAKFGYKEALLQDPHLLNGLNVYLGKVTNQNVAEALGYDYFDPRKLLES